jgi:hypothetical protein
VRWEQTASVDVLASAATVWGVLMDAPRWGEWNDAVEWLWFEGAPRAGMLATMKPKRMRQTAFMVEALEPERLFCLRLRFGPVAALRLAWRLTPTEAGTCLDGGVSIDGVAAGFLKGAAVKIAAAMPATLARLAARAADEKSATVSGRAS